MKHPYYETHKIKSLFNALEISKDNFPNKPLFLQKADGEYKPTTFSEFYDMVVALGTKFIDMGLKDQKIAILGSQQVAWSVAYLAAVSIGVAVPLDVELPVEELNNLIESSEAKILFYNPKLSEKVEKTNVELKINLETEIFSLIEEGKKLFENGDRRFLEHEVDMDKMSILLFTSGTTGNVKGVMLSQNNICENLMNMGKMIKIYKDDVFFSVLPIHHTYECTCGFLYPMYNGNTIAICEGLRHIVKNMQETKPTLILAVPLLLENMHKKIWDSIRKQKKEKTVKFGMCISNFLLKFGIDIRKKLFAQIHSNFGGNLRFLLSGGAPIEKKIVSDFRAFGFSSVQGYGLTETAPLAACNRDCYFNDGAAGLMIPGVDIKIHNPNEKGIGEILIKGPNVMLGYYKNPEATAEVMIDGYFNSGDLGYIDKNGFVFITGRMKNMILTKNGKNVYPEELEVYLNRSPYILESLVSSIDGADDVKIVAQIRIDEEAFIAEFGENYQDKVNDVIKAEVLKVNSLTQTFKHISDYVVREEPFVITTSKKIKRKDPKNQFKK